jgi:DNA-binding transcriptional LysR family regulator
VSTLIGLVEYGLAIALVPQLALPRGRGSVVGVRLEDPSISRSVGLVRRTGRSLTPAAEAFAGLVIDASRARSRPARTAK